VVDYDSIVIGSGFGGSVAALRLSQKGYRVAVIEEGRRWAPEAFPRSTWDSRRYYWLPRLGCFGIQRLDPLRHALVVGGAGVGGGSLVYGNTLFVPRRSFFGRPAIRALGGAAELMPYYELANRMMGTTANPRLFEPDRILRQTAEQYGRGHTFTASPVGVYFGEPERWSPDPYFHGEGPERQGCNTCGGCFVGCRHHAKNSLDRNYLYLAERLGAEIIAERRVTAICPLGEDGAQGFEVQTERSMGARRRPRRYRTRRLVVAAGVMGSVRLLLECKRRGLLPRLSSQLGRDVRTNSEAILGVLAPRGTDYSQGIAASSSVFPDEHTQVQTDRYPAGSDTLALMSSLLVDGGGRIPRALRFAAEAIKRPRELLEVAFPRDFARRCIVLVVMQDHDSSLRLVARRRWLRGGGYGLASKREGEALPTYIPEANEFARRMAKRLGGIALSSLSEVLWDAPATAHILGGCTIAEDPDRGVVDGRQRVFGYRNMLVVDGSVIPTNLGVNPALSILAFAERAMSFIPTKRGDLGGMRLLRVDRRWGVEKLLLRPTTRTPVR